MIYAINYDLSRPGQNYSELHAAIQQCGAWWHYLGSTWLVDSSKTATEIWNHLAPHIDTNDRVLIIRVTKDYQGWLSRDAWNWIDARLLAAA